MAMLAGCLHGASDPSINGNQTGLETSSLEYHLAYESGATLAYRIQVEGITSIRDPKGSSRPTYELTVESLAQAGGENILFKHYLDGSFREVRVDYPCSRKSEAGCTNHGLYWTHSGAVPIFGIGLPAIIREPDPLLAVFGHEVPLRATTAKSGNQLEIHVTDGGPSRAYGSNGRYFYEADRLHPSRIVGTDNGGRAFTAELVEERGGKALDAIASWPRLILPTDDEPNSYALFEGEDDDVFDVGFTARDAYDYLLEHEPTVASTLSNGGCVQDTQYGGLQLTHNKGVPLLESREVPVEFSVDDGTGSLTAWEVTYRSNAGGGEVVVHERGSGSTTKRPCPAAETTGDQILDPQQFIALTNQIPTSSTPREYYYVAENFQPWRPTDIGSSTILASFTSTAGGGSLDTVAMDMQSGWLVQVDLPIEEVERFERDGWPFLSG